MIRKILPLILALVGLGVGLGAGLALRPAPDPEAEHAEEAPVTPTEAAEIDPETAPEYVKLNNQFVVPVLTAGRVSSMVIMALSLEVTKGSSESIYTREPKLRDVFLQVMFDHANAGGFAGSFTDGSNLVLLRKALLEAAQGAVGEAVLDVLISDIARQDGAG